MTLDDFFLSFLVSRSPSLRGFLKLELISLEHCYKILTSIRSCFFLRLFDLWENVGLAGRNMF